MLLSKKWLSSSLILLSSLVFASCGTGQEIQGTSPKIEPIAPTPTQTSKTSFDSIPDSVPSSCPEFDDALQLVNEWADALASRGTVEHEQRVMDFKETVENLNESGGQISTSCPASDELAHLEIQILGVDAMVGSGGVVDDRFYQAVTNAGNEWLATGEHRGLIFKEP